VKRVMRVGSDRMERPATHRRQQGKKSHSTVHTPECIARTQPKIDNSANGNRNCDISCRAGIIEWK